MSLSPDGQTVFTMLVLGKSIRFWDAATGEPRGEPIPIGQSPPINSSYDWTADGKRLFFSDSGERIKVCDVVAGKVVREFPVDADGQGFIAVSPDGQWCAPCSRRNAQSEERGNGGRVRAIKGLEGQVHNLVFSPDGSGLMGTDMSGALKIWSARPGA